jgi:hypothetical protein
MIVGRDNLVTFIFGVLFTLFLLRLTTFKHVEAGLLLLSLWYRDVVVGVVIALGLYLLDVVLILLLLPDKVRERAKAAWSVIITAKLEGRKASCPSGDVIDDAVRLKVAMQRRFFHAGGSGNEA